MTAHIDPVAEIVNALVAVQDDLAKLGQAMPKHGEAARLAAANAVSKRLDETAGTLDKHLDKLAAALKDASKTASEARAAASDAAAAGMATPLHIAILGVLAASALGFAAGYLAGHLKRPDPWAACPADRLVVAKDGSSWCRIFLGPGG